MRIAVVDVAAESGGALSVLKDFAEVLREEGDLQDEWYIITSIIDIPESRNIHNIKVPYVKRSWLHRLWWEYTDFRKIVSDFKIDVILSLQNNALPVKKIKQLVYFHNILLVADNCRFSFWNKDEQILAVYQKILAPYIRHTWKNADALIVQRNSAKEEAGRYFPKKCIYVCRPKIRIEAVKNNSGKIRGFIYPTAATVYKNLELVVAAVRALERAGEKTEVLITISGHENDYAEKIAQMAAKTEGVRLIGYQSREFILEKYQEYGLVITSRCESFPIPLVEAMQCRTVIAALDVPYVRDIMQSARYNRVYLAKDKAGSLAAAMRAALRDEQKGSYCEEEECGMRRVVRLVEEIGKRG